MSVHLQREIDRLQKYLLSLGAIVEDQVQLAVRAFLERDTELAREVEQRDPDIDHREVELEEECLKTLALYQPVAVDLRFIIAALKINNDLERIGDLAVNVAHKAAAYAADVPIAIHFDLSAMGTKVLAMLHDSLESLIDLDPQLATEVCRRDDEIDVMKHDNRVQVEEQIRCQPELVSPLLRLLAVSRNLERIADCATNIAEDVVYMTSGKIIRHGDDEI